jgi:hypothetical protein
MVLEKSRRVWWIRELKKDGMYRQIGSIGILKKCT